jgi:ribose 5-phosphate isomerase B
MSATPIVIGADHAGYDLKESLKAHLSAQGYAVIDVGCANSGQSVDYPLIAAAVVAAKREQGAPFAILCCGSGVGVSIAANRFPDIRAVLAQDVYLARLSRQHNDANLLCLGARFTAAEYAQVILDAWLAEPFEGERHARRVDQLANLTVSPVNEGCSTTC